MDRELKPEDVRLVSSPNLSLETCSDRLIMTHGPGKRIDLTEQMNKTEQSGYINKLIVEAETPGLDILAPRKLLGYVLKIEENALRIKGDRKQRFFYYSTGQKLPKHILTSNAVVYLRVERC